jgi:Trp operon repressor
MVLNSACYRNMSVNVSPSDKHQHQQVLSLCMPCAEDTKTLLRYGMISKLMRDEVRAYTQQELPSLIAAAITAGLEHGKSLPKHGKSTSQAALDSISNPLKWLLSTAGPAAVAAPAVTNVLLRVTQDIPNELHESIPEMAFECGLQLTADQLLESSKQRVRGTEMWINAAASHPAAAAAAAGSSGTLWRCISACCWENLGEVKHATIYLPCLQCLMLINCHSRSSKAWLAYCVNASN